MKSYDPNECRVTVNDIEIEIEEVAADIFENYLLNIKITPMSIYPEDHPDYNANLTQVDVIGVSDGKGATHRISFRLRNDSSYLQEILALVPYDKTTITIK
jgi:hypothetical protein